MADLIVKSKFYNTLAERIVPILTWLLITFPIWLSPFHPAVVAYFIIAFDLYFFYKSLNTAYYATVSYLKILEYAKIPFNAKLAKLKGAADIHHFIIIPNYKEPLYKLETTIDNIVKNDYPFRKIILVLAFEDRETEAAEKADTIRKKFGFFFSDILETYHTLKPHEEAGKASNQAHSARIVEEYAYARKMDFENTVITICDADSRFPVNYFSYLTYTFIKDRDKRYHFYWAPVLLYNNIWQLPFFVRIQATLSSILRLAFLSQKDNLIQISTYSASLWLLRSVGYWDVDIIPEDWHIYYQAFFQHGEKVLTIPLYTIVNGDAVYSGKVTKTLANRYEQEKRWAWGVTDVGYALKKMFITPHIKPWVKIRKIFYLAESHLLWPTSFFILTLASSVPPLINPMFKRTVLGYLLPKLSGLILTLASSMLIAYIYLDIKIRKKSSVETRLESLPLLIIQWYLLPVISFFLSSLPALESHTRLLLGKKLKYKVTEKV